MAYKYTGYAKAGTLARRLTNLAEQYAADVANLQEARDEATAALAAQIRATRDAADDKALVRGEIARQRDRRLASR